jgi:hypothetical protein
LHPVPITSSLPFLSLFLSLSQRAAISNILGTMGDRLLYVPIDVTAYRLGIGVGQDGCHKPGTSEFCNAQGLS